MKKRRKIIYWTSTLAITALMLMSVSMYLFNHEEIRAAFTNLGYPTYLIYPLAVAKILGLIAILTDKSKMLKEWAYAGFFFDFVLAFFAHIMVADGQYPGALVATILLIISYVYDKLAFSEDTK
jgi:hypothetical protein